MEPEIYENVNNRILLIGKSRNAFVNGNIPSGDNIVLCDDINSGLVSAGQGNWDVVAVVIEGSNGFLKSILSQIRARQPYSRIILLSKMSSEPLAIELVGIAGNDSRLADDYLICPVEASDFFQAVVFPKVRQRPALEDKEANIELQKRLRQLEILATTDELTGLKNRRYVWEFCAQIIDYAKSRSGRVTLLMFDIDYFKHYNDTYSHTAGDQILKQVAVLIRRCCRPHDVVGRIGGDEFVVIFWDVPAKRNALKETERRSLQSHHPQEAILIAQRFREELKKTRLQLLGSESEAALTISGGLASFPKDGSTAQELFEQADKALLEAKKSGKNRIYLVGKPSFDSESID